ncbi:Reverse transcriptase domain-containing protein [Aphis craccivora]|uniref:Reverse transcriptase domain-containing protein n=1 Tax=Aphis craccivora TaxID=307492 RepID=A0A6G0YIF9_APHCR|nr:Reverse transcriptase domain-containing protein [Aphis craccivora]
MKKYKILSPPGPTYWPTSVRKKHDILDIFVTKLPTTNRLKFHNIIAEEINLKISLKFAREIDHAVNYLITLIQSAASKSNTLNTTKNSAHNHPFVSEQVRSLIVEKRRKRTCYQITRLPLHKSAYKVN